MEPEQNISGSVQTKEFPSIRLLLSVLAILVLIGGGVFLRKYDWGHDFGLAESSRDAYVGGVPEFKTKISSMFESSRAGDYQAAKTQRDALLADPSITPTQEAVVKLNTTRVNFKISGDINDQLQGIRDLKKIFLDENVDQYIRVLALNRLAFSYCASGRDPLAFQELYKDEPFSKYKASDPDVSARNLAEWSYSIKPTAFAAVRVARWYSQQYANNKSISDAKREEYGALGRKYVSSGESLVPERVAMDPGFLNSSEYAEYLFWLARDISWLATRGDKTYASKYRQAYENAINEILRQESDVSRGTLLFTRQYFARFALRLENDAKTTKTQLDEIAKEMNAMQRPLTSIFVRVLRNESKNNPKGDTWSGVLAMMKYSPSYKAAVEKVIAIPEVAGEEDASLALETHLTD